MFVFASFGDSVNFKNALRTIENEAKNLNIFDKIYIYNETKLDNSFLEKHLSFMKSNRRGFGYWIWKPQVIKQTFATLKDGDTIVYADSGCRLNKSGLNRLLEYKSLCENSESKNVSFPLSYRFNLDGSKSSHFEKLWTKGDVYNMFDLKDKEPAQLVGGIFLITKCDKTVEMVDKWLSLAENYHNIDDSPSVIPNNPGFKEHRHDQSLWSVIRKHYGTEMLEVDETYYTNFDKNMDKPIHAIRRK